MKDSSSDRLDNHKLSQACCGDSVKIVDIDSESQNLRRVQAMGICRGRTIEVQRDSDPMIVKVHQTRIALATSIVKVAAKFISEHCLIVMLPVFLFIVTLFFLVLWVLQALGFYSLGTPYHTTHQYPFAHFRISAWIEVLFVIHVIFLLWTLMFFI